MRILFALAPVFLFCAVHAERTGNSIPNTPHAAPKRGSAPSSGWTNIAGGLPDIGVLCFLKDGETAYAGTADGVLFSPDSGKTWESRSAGLPLANYNQLLKHGSSIIAISIEFGVCYKSDNQGKAWEAVSWNSTGVGRQIWSAISFDGALFLGEGSNRQKGYFDGKTEGLLQSLDGGKTWSFMRMDGPVKGMVLSGDSLLLFDFTKMFSCKSAKDSCKDVTPPSIKSSQGGMMAYMFASGSHLWAWEKPSIWDGKYSYYTWYSADGGQSWDSLPAPNDMRDIRPVEFFTPDRLIGFKIGGNVVGGNLLISPDSGKTWQSSNAGISGKVNAVMTSGSRWLAGADSGLFESLDQGETWRPKRIGCLPSVNDIETKGEEIWAATEAGLFSINKQSRVLLDLNGGQHPQFMALNPKTPTLLGFFEGGLDFHSFTVAPFPYNRDVHLQVTAYGAYRVRKSVTVGNVLFVIEPGGRDLTGFSNPGDRIIMRHYPDSNHTIGGQEDTRISDLAALNGKLIALTSNRGVWISDTNFGNWTRPEQALPAENIRALATLSDKVIAIVGNDVYAADTLLEWKSLMHESADSLTEPLSLFESNDTALCAATAHDVHCFDFVSGQWDRLTTGLDLKTSITSLAIGSGYVALGTQAEGLWTLDYIPAALQPNRASVPRRKKPSLYFNRKALTGKSAPAINSLGRKVGAGAGRNTILILDAPGGKASTP
jgi:photosystem II stability/assembly factor-like uncharacterized protein